MNDDEKDLLSSLGELDWESALEEWEKTSFADDPAAQKRDDEPAPATASAPTEEIAPAPSLGELSGEGTVVAEVPEELRAETRPPPAATPPPPRPERENRSSLPPPASRGGGLGQLFSRPPPRPAPPPRPEPPVAPSLDVETTVKEASSLQEMLEREIASRLSSVTGEGPAAEDRFDPASVDQSWVETIERPKADLGDAPTVSKRDEDIGPESETLVSDLARPALDDEADTQDRLPAEGEPLTRRSSVRQAVAEGARLPESRRERAPSPLGSTEIEEERPAPTWLDEEATAAYRVRAAWLEEEARAAEGDVRARGLLAVSELCAIANDPERALEVALEARDLAPHLPLAWRQARQLSPRDPDVLVEALEGEASRSVTPAARAHATLLAADLLRVHQRGDEAVYRWESAYKLDPADVRAPVARAALALAQNQHASGALFLSENSELIALDRAVATALRLRGHPRPGSDADEMAVNDAMRKARTALASDDVVGAAQAIATIARSQELAKAALWLSSSFGCTRIAGRRAAARAQRTLASGGDGLARRALAARGIELGDPELVAVALAADAESTDVRAFDTADRGVLQALAGRDPTSAVEELEAEAADAALVDALSALALANGDYDAVTRAGRTAGRADARREARLGRLLAARPADEVIDDALRAIPAPRSASAAGVALEAAIRAERWSEVSQALSELPANDDGSFPGARHVASAMAAERAEDADGARRAFRAAVDEGTTHDGVVRIAASLDPTLDLAAELLRIADEMPDGAESAILRLEAIARAPGRSDDERRPILERVHDAAPTLGLGASLAERIARRHGDLDEVLRWIQERRSNSTDSLELALDAVREALLVADRDAELASTRLEEAQRARPDDFALRELYERLSTDPVEGRAAWREARANKAERAARAQLYVEAALEHERAGDHADALRDARLAEEAGDNGLGRLIAVRAQTALGETTTVVERLVARAEEAASDADRREAYDELAAVDDESADAWREKLLAVDPKHLPTLRSLEHAAIDAGDDARIESVAERIAHALDGSAGGEVTAHAQIVARFRMRRAKDEGGGWEQTADSARLAATQPEPSLWGLRAHNAHSRLKHDDEAVLKTTLSLLERTQRPAERAALLLRASEAAAVLEHVADARTYLEQSANEDPGDVVTWGFLAEVRERGGETRAAAEACESVARTSVVATHQLLAWCDAAKMWLDEVEDTERGMSALEAAAEIDVTYGEVFSRLSALYVEKHLDSELARLLEKRLTRCEDQGERVGLQVELARALADIGEVGKAKQTLMSALEQRPDHTTALGALAETCMTEGDWSGAEQAYVRLARLVAAPGEQRALYEKLGELYATHLGNLSRAEVAYRELLKHAPNDPTVLGKLVDVYRRQHDVARAAETQEQLVSEATDPSVRLTGLIELASIYETVGRDPRRAEQVLDAARKEYPTSVVALRAMAELYLRQRQAPAMHILLDRAASDARRAFAQGRFVPALFEVLHAAFDLRGKHGAARVVAATLAAIEGQPVTIQGAEARAVDHRLDELLAPDLLSPSLRALLARTGDALDVVAPVDLRALRAQPLVPGSPIAATVGAIATFVGLGAMQIFVSPTLGRVALPLSSNPPALLVGSALAEVEDERARSFVVMRAMKMFFTRASALLRARPDDAASLVAALIATFNPGFVPEGVDAKRVAELVQRIGPALPRGLDPSIGVLALEAAGNLGSRGSRLSAATHAWANRVALLSIGDPNPALDALAWARGSDTAPKGSEERAAWVARTPEARELMTFSVSEHYAEARARVGLDR